MKRTLYILTALFALLLGASQSTFANEREDEISSKVHNMVVPKGDGLFTIKVPVYIGSKSGNYFASSGGFSAVTIKLNNIPYTLVRYKANNWANDPGSTNDLEVMVDPDAKGFGMCIFTNSKKERIEDSGGTGEWKKLNLRMTKSVDNEYNMTFLEFDWQGSLAMFKDKDIPFESNLVFSSWWYENDIRFNIDMGTYKFSSNLIPPIIAGAYPDPDVTAGNEGQMHVTAASSVQTETIHLIVNDQIESMTTCTSNSIEFSMPQCDTTRVLQIRACYNQNGLRTYLTSQPYTIKPYHRIHDLKVTEEAYLHPVDSAGYKRLTWRIDTKTLNDLFETDGFIIERASKPDMSDITQIGAITITDTTTLGHYMFRDTAPEAVFNEEGGTKMYYRVRRTSAGSLFSTEYNKFSVKDSVENIMGYHPKVTSLTLGESEDFEFSHKLRINIHFDYRKHIDWNRGIVKAKWNDKARVKIYVTRHNKEHKELGIDSFYVDTKGLQLDTVHGEYILPYDCVLPEPEVIYGFRAKCERSAAAPNMLFAHTTDDPTRDEGCDFPGSKSYSGLSPARNVKATQGTEYGRVHVTWDLPGNRIDQIEVLRRDAWNWKTIATLDPSNRSYDDLDTDLDVKYEYAILLKANYYGTEVTSRSDSAKDYVPAIGWISPVGRISGKVGTEQGTGIAAQKMVLLKGDDKVAETMTKDDGTFVFDSVRIVNYALTYTVQAQSDKLEFLHNGDKVPATVQLSSRNADVSGVNFVCTSVVRVTGRAMFANSTVPVGGAMFRINGETVHDSNNQPVKTDNNGDFVLFVPKQQVTVQIFKPGHRFESDGFILGGENGEKEFTPTEPMLGLTLYDETKVLLRGRVIGGNTLAAKPLGQGLTQNNLGDNITLQLKLEGNNTSDIVFLKDNPEKDSLTVYNTQTWSGETVSTTRGDFFRKQIDIHVDNATGEYSMELFPAKYKVTQAFAQGYASLFPNGQAAQILDLTDSVGVDSTKATIATYSITYHSDIALTYRQMQYGAIEQSFFGEETYDEQNLMGEKIGAKLAYKDEDDNTHYLLGAPLFFTGERYYLRGTAHEDYYYNNVPTGKHYQELIKDGTVRVENGFAAQNPPVETFTLDDKGQFMLKFVANNDNFALSGEDAMRQINSSIELNGFFYQSEPLKAYVTGMRNKEGSMYTTTSKDAKIELLDILRDPIGGYSSVGKGKEYSMSRNFNVKVALALDLGIKSGVSYNTIVGVVEGPVLTATSSEGSTTYQTSVNIPLGGVNVKRSATYNFSASETVTTSGDPLDNGAEADVYVGTTTDVICQVKQTISLIDEATYKLMTPSIEAGAIKVIQKGKQSDGRIFYLVTAEKIQPGCSMPSTFAYSQEHILTSILPQLMTARNELLYGGEEGVDKDMVQAMANKQNKALYFYKGASKATAGVGKINIDYEPCYPQSWDEKAKTDEIALYNNRIWQWVNMIAFNEKLKLEAPLSGATPTNYSISAGQKVSYSENISYRDTGIKVVGNALGFATNGFAAANLNKSNVANIVNKIVKSAIDALPDSKSTKGTPADLVKMTKAFESLFSTYDPQHTIFDFVTPTSKITFNIKPTLTFEWNDNIDGAKQTTYSSGYEIEVKDDSYANISVYKVPAKTLGEEFDAMCEAHNWVTNYADNTELLHQYVFQVNGGATRNPWCDADSTLFYNPGTPLGVRTMRIDNPKLALSATEVSNVPEDEKAVFTIKLTNDSELPANQTVAHPSTFTLLLEDDSNPNGAKVYIDGMPLVGGRTFLIEPRATITKTVEVARGVGYDFNDLRFKLASADYNNLAYANFSVHFQRSSSPVKVSSPTDKWVMNTFSAKDSVGYYIPIVVEGYDINYNNFDHIEIQYKKSTEGEASWVNLCSYYADDALYEAASGTKSKEQIRTGKITHAFYGEKDPNEMRYDIRAVTFCRQGTSFVTKASNVISGTKDTRKPVIFGQSQPLNGILTSENNIILPFSEPIAYNYLDKTSNFDIRGYVNNDNIDTNVGLVFGGTPTQDAHSEVKRNLSLRDFTIDMLVKTDEDMKEMAFFSHGQPEDRETFTFGVNNYRQLFVNCRGKIALSRPLTQPLNQGFTHIGAIYTKRDADNSESTPNVRFFVGNSIIETEIHDTIPEYEGISELHFGTCIDTLAGGYDPFKGRMLEVRLWNQAIDNDMISQYNNNQLDGHCSRIIGYWPMRQTSGNAADKVNGADLTLKDVNWHTADGYSLALKNKSIQLDPTPFERSKVLDYTLSFWMRIRKACDNSQIFAAGNDSLSEEGKGKLRIGFRKGALTVASNGNNITTEQKIASLADSKWHHFALSVSHTQNLAHVFIDSRPVAQVPGDKLDGITSECIRLGSDSLEANFDEFALWHQALPQNFLNSFKDYCINGDEMGLWVYMPFEHTEESSQGITSIKFTPVNKSKLNKDGYGKNMLKGFSEETDVEHICAPVIGHMPLKKYEFTWSSDGTNLLINLDMPNKQINRNNIFLTVRDVEDVNGNTMASPYTWTIFTDRNLLRWITDDHKQEFVKGTTLTQEIAWRNITANRINYTIRSSSPYIHIDDEQGIAEPSKTQILSYTIDSNMPVGNYVEYIWLEDVDNSMISTLTIKLSVTPQMPIWSVDSKRYDQTMSIIASVWKKAPDAEYLLTDTNDQVAVFHGSECLGIANLHNEATAQLYITVHGNISLEGKTLSFYLFDYSTGNITMLTPDQEVKFKANSNIGVPPANKLKLTTSNTKMQSFPLNEGWNWISLNITPLTSSLANGAILSNSVFNNKDMFKSDSQHSEYSATKNKWLLDDIQLSHKKVYHVYVDYPTEFFIIGNALTANDRVIHVKQGWNELPYPLTYSLTIQRAMADYQNHDKATEGDIVRGHDSFAVLTDGYNWVGTLKELAPGNGYYLFHQGSNETDIVINSTQSNNLDTSKKAKAKDAASGEHNMIIIAALDDEASLPTDAVVDVHYSPEGVCHAEPIVLPDGSRRYFITVPETTSPVSFTLDDATGAPVTVGTLPFNGAACVGTLDRPFILTPNALSADGEPAYDLSGRRAPETNGGSRNVRVQKGKKVMK